MAIVKTIYLSDTAANLLKNCNNASALINELIIKHFEFQNINSLSDEDKLKELKKQLNIKLLEKEYNEKVKALKNNGN